MHIVDVRNTSAVQTIRLDPPFQVQHKISGLAWAPQVPFDPLLELERLSFDPPLELDMLPFGPLLEGLERPLAAND